MVTLKWTFHCLTITRNIMELGQVPSTAKELFDKASLVESHENKQHCCLFAASIQLVQ